ncbi:unnamed protein product [Rotaria socialis]|uniref:TBC1 domain family member 23 n=1 Tax=Rotaria socialis TaxID=392032 RepID=A0A820L9G7_9BILA|nr:unnamed protein product [Rotaria socialis]CAF3590982.1 unnamed protein product [Rotaria socialis]CAF4357293.1 unnamed protein product [Rotaria socialis]CAF4393361.1 unnamed protein product [Rotaria socialis]
MSDDNKQAFNLEDDSDLNGDDNEVFHSDEENNKKNQDNQWIDELRLALKGGCDLGSIRSIGKCRPLTDDLRLSVWKTCLNINDINEYDYVDSDVFDLPEQNLIREDVLRLVRSLKINEDIEASRLSDIEAVLTFYCKKYNENYEKDNGWIDMLKPLVTLDYKDRAELYALFASIRNRYIPCFCETDGMPFHLFRLLLLYHDPELCSFFDTRKITPDLYAHIWVRSLYAGTCSSDVTRHLWDGYFQHADQFFIFFLALVLLMFVKEQLFEMIDKEKDEVINLISKAPANLTTDDLEDFCSLANHYASNTPQSFRKEFCSCLFDETDRTTSQKAYSVQQALCLPVSAKELLQANQLGGKEGVKYFIVDCRPAEQYNSKHLYTAFHLDANLLLEDPKEFGGTVDALRATQKHSIEAGATAGGDHLCFMGSGRDEEDKYVRMVVAYFLRRNIKYISIASGGYRVLAKAIEDPSMITKAKSNTDKIKKHEETSIGFAIKQNIAEKLPVINTQTTALFSMISSAVKTKSMEVRDKVKDYITHNSSSESANSTASHVSKEDKVGKLYRQPNQASVFSLDDDQEQEDEKTLSKQQDAPELVDVESWFLRSDMLYKYECEHIDEHNRTHPSLLLVSSTHLFILRKLPEHKTMANLVSRRPLESITKITSKKNFPEIITFRYATNQDEQEKKVKAKTKLSIDCDRVYLPDAGDATKNIKLLIVKSLNMFDNPNEIGST